MHMVRETAQALPMLIQQPSYTQEPLKAERNIPSSSRRLAKQMDLGLGDILLLLGRALNVQSLGDASFPSPSATNRHCRYPAYGTELF